MLKIKSQLSGYKPVRPAFELSTPDRINIIVKLALTDVEKSNNENVEPLPLLIRPSVVHITIYGSGLCNYFVNENRQ